MTPEAAHHAREETPVDITLYIYIRMAVWMNPSWTWRKAVLIFYFSFVSSAASALFALALAASLA